MLDRDVADRICIDDILQNAIILGNAQKVLPQSFTKQSSHIIDSNCNEMNELMLL